MDQHSRRICVGKITSAHGIRGQVKIHSYTEDPKTITTYKHLSSKSGGTEFHIKVTSVKGPVVIASIDGVNNRNDAEKLRNTEFYILRDELPDAVEGEFYHEDLVGLKALLENGTVFGEVVSVQNYGAGDILEVKRADNGKTDLLLFNDETVPSISLEAGELTLHLPEVVVVNSPKDEQAGDE